MISLSLGYFFALPVFGSSFDGLLLSSRRATHQKLQPLSASRDSEAVAKSLSNAVTWVSKLINRYEGALCFKASERDLDVFDGRGARYVLGICLHIISGGIFGPMLRYVH
jgi:hypothetical protein